LLTSLDEARKDVRSEFMMMDVMGYGALVNVLGGRMVDEYR
jgi:hypothetical protein